MDLVNITLLNPEGPSGAGLNVLPPIPPETVISGTPVQKGFRYYEEQESSFRAGVWGCTAFQSITEPHTVHEFMHLLEGTVAIVHGDGSELVVSKGERFFIPKGTIRSWKQTGPVLKYYMIFPDPKGPAPQDPESLRAFKIEADSTAKAGNGASAVKPIYKDPTGRYSIGIWDPALAGRDLEPLAATEMFLPVDSALTLLGDDGEHAVGVGEAALVKAGTKFGWRPTKPTSVIYCAFNPS